MPDYSLKRSNPPQGQNQQQHSPISQLSQASDSAKKDTEIALLREALATSAQNYEVLTKQFTESQWEINNNMMVSVEMIQDTATEIKNTTFQSMEELLSITSQNDQRCQEQLQNLQSQNQLFSQNLSAVLTSIANKLVEQVKVDTVNALQANMEAMNIAVQKNFTTLEDAVKTHIKAISTAHTNMEKANTKVVNYDKHLKTLLDNRLKRSKESISKIFEVDGLKRFFFWAGLVCSIL